MTYRTNELANDASEYLPLNEECELAIWHRAVTVKAVYSKPVAIEMLRRLADELEVLP